MGDYIVLDLEWNQSAYGKVDSVDDFPFEIIEVGAVRLDRDFHICGQFRRLVRPQVYRQMHYAISEVTHMSMGELQEHGESFERVVRDFLAWCGEDVVFCTWGPMDLTELQRNMKYFQVENRFPKPLFYYDIQKLYGLFFQDGAKVSLDAVVEELGIREDRPFHRALDDAYYTGKVLSVMTKQRPWAEYSPYKSIDYYRLPQTKKEEIRIIFPDYSKYVSRPFPSREEALKERAVTEMRCYVCGKALRKKVRWFSPNQKIYYALAVCPEHGYLKGKLRMKHLSDTEVFVVKTLKLTDEAGAGEIRGRKEDVRKRRAERSRAKRRREAEEKRTERVREKGKARGKEKNEEKERIREKRNEKGGG